MPLRHVTLIVSDVSRSAAFYEAVLAPLGLIRAAEYADEEEPPGELPPEVVGFGAVGHEPQLWLAAGGSPSVHVHLAFGARTRSAVEAFSAAAVTHGGTAQQAPRRWEIYRPGYFGALVVDLDGNLVEAFIDS